VHTWELDMCAWITGDFALKIVRACRCSALKLYDNCFWPSSKQVGKFMLRYMHLCRCNDTELYAFASG